MGAKTFAIIISEEASDISNLSLGPGSVYLAHCTLKYYALQLIYTLDISKLNGQKINFYTFTDYL